MNTFFIGKVRLYYDSLDSTNLEAERLLRSTTPIKEGTSVITYNQSAGRGQMGNQWFNDTLKNITLSFILFPDLAPRFAFLINQAIALGIRDTIQHYTSKQVHIKWPNDILIENRKVCGVLIQNSLSSRTISSSIVGIGINVNQNEFPQGIGQPTSLFLETQQEIDLGAIEQLLYEKIEPYYLLIKNEQWEELHDSYESFLYQKDQWSSYKNVQGERFKGKIIGVEKDGRLRVETAFGVQFFMFKEISIA